MQESEIFTRALRQMRRARALNMAESQGEALLVTLATDDIIERLDAGGRRYTRALLWNKSAVRLAAWLEAQGTQVVFCDPATAPHEDRSQFEAASFDLILSIGLLESVNDVPGALLLMRRALQPSGKLLVSFAGHGSFGNFKTLWRKYEPHIQRFHPQIDVRAGGDLLARAGFAEPVSDRIEYKLVYSSAKTLIADLRSHAATNMLREQHPLARQMWRSICDDLNQGHEDMLSIVTLTATKA
jgi:NADH dehydrogenase [ubiquinone] 1 alpha subcomplex assembly factor 5